jgi:hypothetical protein
MQISLKYKQSQIEGALHSVLLQVLAELNYGVEGVGGLDGVGVVSDDDGLGSLECDDTLFALELLLVLVYCEMETSDGYLLGLERVVACLDGHVLDAIDLDAFGDDLLGL